MTTSAGGPLDDGQPIPLQFLGGGRMAAAMIGGLLASGAWQHREIHVVEVDSTAQARLLEIWPELRVSDAPVAADGTIVAVKPGLAVEVLGRASQVGVGRVLSLAAGVSLDALEAATPPGTPVVRSMPNTAALVGKGVAAVTGGSSAEERDVAWAESLLGAVGSVVRVPEHLLDGVTGLSGSGPAYVFLIAEAMIDGGVNVGLSREVATALAVDTIAGAAALMSESGRDPMSLRADVTSPGGTTAAGLRTLERHGVRSAVIEAIAAAARRSKELG
jgi:pyrroline-5-carboxylate reductase